MHNKESFTVVLVSLCQVMGGLHKINDNQTCADKKQKQFAIEHVHPSWELTIKSKINGSYIYIYIIYGTSMDMVDIPSGND